MRQRNFASITLKPANFRSRCSAYPICMPSRPAVQSSLHRCSSRYLPVQFKWMNRPRSRCLRSVQKNWLISLPGCSIHGRRSRSDLRCRMFLGIRRSSWARCCKSCSPGCRCCTAPIPSRPIPQRIILSAAGMAGSSGTAFWMICPRSIMCGVPSRQRKKALHAKRWIRSARARVCCGW